MFQKILIAPALLAIKIYQKMISPVLAAIGVRCRHYPSCSAYSYEALQRHGLWRGGWLCISRLMRCHPWGSFGIDFVPDSQAKVGWRFWKLGDWAWTERVPHEEHCQTCAGSNAMLGHGAVSALEKDKEATQSNFVAVNATETGQEDRN